MASLIRLKQIESGSELQTSAEVGADFSSSVFEIIDGAGLFSSSAQVELVSASGYNELATDIEVAVISSSVSTSIAILSQTYVTTASLDNLSSSIATEFSSSNANVVSISSSTFTTISNLSSSIDTTISQSNANILTISSSIDSTIISLSSSFANSVSGNIANFEEFSSSVDNHIGLINIHTASMNEFSESINIFSSSLDEFYATDLELSQSQSTIKVDMGEF